MPDAKVLDELLGLMPRDALRLQCPFSQDMVACNNVLFDPLMSRQAKANSINEWLHSPAIPCIFARIAAKQGAMSYCIVNEGDIAKGDEFVRGVVQDARETWKKDALSGKKHGLVLIVASKQLAFSEPGDLLKRFALKLLELYFSESAVNRILRDELALEVRSGHDIERRRWRVGINFHSAQGDGRWWHDHRIPGGVAFSMNSVGHMARVRGEARIRADVRFKDREITEKMLHSWALGAAMQTILQASKGSFPGTRLAGTEVQPNNPEVAAYEPRELPGNLDKYSKDFYLGLYHTDVSVPEEYFDPRQDRPNHINEQQLEFSYLHREVDPDYETMALGWTDDNA